MTARPTCAWCSPTTATAPASGSRSSRCPPTNGNSACRRSTPTRHAPTGVGLCPARRTKPLQPAKLSLWEKVVPDLAFDGLGWHGTCPACHTNALELRVYSESEFDVLCHTPRCSGPAAIQAARVLLAGVGRTAAESPTPNAQRPNAQCPTPDAPGFPFLSIEQVLALPLPRYQVHGLIYEQSLVQFFGEPGPGKSFLCLDLGLSFAAGAPGWFGHRIERPGPVAWINADGGRGFIHRLRAWRQAHTAPLAHPFLTLMG